MKGYKIMRVTFGRTSPEVEYSAEDALNFTLTPDPYSYDDQLGRLKRVTELQEEMLVKLISKLWASDKLSPEDMGDLLSHQFAVTTREFESCVPEVDGD